MAPPTQVKGKLKKRNSKKSKTIFSKETYLLWFEKMLLARRFEERAGMLYGQQKIRGFCHLYIGQEACIAGAFTALDKGDKWITAYRDHVHPIVLGTDPKAVMAELYAKETGVSKGKGGSMHIFDKAHNFFGGHGIVGGQIPLGVGIGFAEQYNKTKNLCICFMGDGAVRQGAFHEALNLAMLWKLPVIFAIENNGYAMGTSVQRTSNNVALHTLATSYHMPSEVVDGMKVEEVHKAVARAAERARKQGGPTLIEFNTYRYKGHSMSDPAKYRSKKEVEEYKQRDPIEWVRDLIMKGKMVPKKKIEEIEQEVAKKIEECVQFAEASSYPSPDKVLKDVYAQEDYPFILD